MLMLRLISLHRFTRPSEDKAMAHLVDIETRTPQWGLKALVPAARHLMSAANWLGLGTTKDVSNLRPASLGATHAAPGQPYGAFRPETVLHLRKILENGYIEEESGNRVHIPAYIRSQLISELRLLS